jgi:hypothetical protein
MIQTLAQLLAGQDALQGVVRRVSARSILVRIAEVDVELPLQSAPVTAGQVVEITRQDEQTIALKVLVDPPAFAPETEQPLTPTQLGQALKALNIPPTEEAILVAQGLVERGFPLQESLVWSLLPWAEEGQLTEAFLALQAKFPLKPEVLALAQQLQGRAVGEPVLPEASEGLPLDLQELFLKPSLDNRSSWSNRLSEGKVFKALARLLVEERFVESLLSRGAHHNQSEHLFTLPFLRKDDLYAGWLRITRDDSAAEERSDGEEKTSYRLELEIPTATFGVVSAEVFVIGRSVSVNLRADGLEAMKVPLQELAEELQLAGWKIRQLQIRGWDDA